MKTIFVLACESQRDVLDGQCAVSDECDTVKEAKHRAKYVLTDAFQRSCEMARPLGYSQVVVNGECVYDYFRRE